MKHGVSKQRLGGEVTVSARTSMPPNRRAPALVLIVSGQAGAEPLPRRSSSRRQAGVGLNNVERRLACQYGAAASLSIRSGPNAGTSVEIRLPVERIVAIEPALQGAAR